MYSAAYLMKDQSGNTVKNMISQGYCFIGGKRKYNLAGQIITSAGSGLIVEPGDETGFLDAAAKLHGDPALRTTLGEKARHYAEATFDIDRIGREFEAIIANAIEQAGSGEP